MYIKRILIVIMLVNIILTNSKCVLANEAEEGLTREEVINEINTINASIGLKDEPNLNSRSAIIYDRNSKEIIWGKEENVRRKMASTTKVVHT